MRDNRQSTCSHQMNLVAIEGTSYSPQNYIVAIEVLVL